MRPIDLRKKYNNIRLTECLIQLMLPSQNSTD